MRIIDNKYFDQYHDLIGNLIDKFIDSFEFAEKTTDLGYKTQSIRQYIHRILREIVLI